MALLILTAAACATEAPNGGGPSGDPPLETAASATALVDPSAGRLQARTHCR
jgi:hypothetical protein